MDSSELSVLMRETLARLDDQPLSRWAYRSAVTIVRSWLWVQVDLGLIDRADAEAWATALSVDEGRAFPPQTRSDRPVRYEGDFPGTMLRLVASHELGVVGRIRVVAVEVYEHQTIVRWCLDDMAGQSDWEYVGGLTLSDDALTVYSVWEMRAPVVHGAARGETVFFPSVPPNARVLAVGHRTEPTAIEVTL